MTEDRYDRITASVLGIGVAVSAALVAIGFGLALVAGWTTSLLGKPLPPTATTDFSGLLERLLALQPLAIVQLGLIVLVATPIVRVVITALGFWRQHDRLYVGVSLIVLALLFVSLSLLR